MIHKIKKALKTRKVKLFLIFLTCSGLAWFVSNLSETFTSNSTFKLQYANIPQNYVITGSSKDEVHVRLRAGGFQFLGFSIRKKKVHLDLSLAERMDSSLFIPAAKYRRQIERQLPGSMSLLQIDEDTIFFDFYEVESKKIPIRPKILLNLSQNFLLDGELQMQPDSITVIGPKREIDIIDYINTEKIDLTSATSTFSTKVALEEFTELANTTLSTNAITLNGKVARFSERVIEVPIDVINLPSGFKIRTFPNKAKVLCRAKLNDLKQLSPSDFKIVADYETVAGTKTNNLMLAIAKQPANVGNVRLEETQVEFILNRE